VELFRRVPAPHTTKHIESFCLSKDLIQIETALRTRV
jgi:hypothetical protein